MTLSISHLLMAGLVAVMLLAPHRLAGIVKSIRGTSKEVKGIRDEVTKQVDELKTQTASLEAEVQSALGTSKATVTAPKPAAAKAATKAPELGHRKKHRTRTS